MMQAAYMLMLLALSAVAQSDAAVPPPADDGGGTIKATDRGTFDLSVADMPLSVVLELLSIQGKRNIVASPQVRGSVTANLYDVTFEEAMEAVLTPNGAVHRQSGKFYYVYTREELDLLNAAKSHKPATRVFHLNYISAADAITYIQPIVGKDGTVAAPPATASGLASEAAEGGGKSNAQNDFIVVTAAPSIMLEIDRLLKQIDVRPRQVLVEATILRAELTDDNALGIDFTLVGGVDLELLNGRSIAIQNLALGELPQARFENFNSAAETDFRGNVPDGGISVGIIKDHVAVFLRALEQVTDTTVLANPKILALNRQKGQVIVGRRDGYLTTTVTETQAVQTVEYLVTGTQLIFRPFIGDDGWVRVELHPEDSVGFISAQGLPSEQTTEVTTNVMVRDNETILIGGLFREVTTDSRSQVPGLGSIPYLGPLFRSQADSTGREEVIILLTIHVVKDQDAYVENSLAIWDDMERMRVGMRQGLMWHGRTRLAQSHYQKALDAWNSGNCSRALWHLDLALYNNPRMLPAIEFKEELVAERDWEHENAIGRMFIHRLINRGREESLAPFGRPVPALEPPGHAPVAEDISESQQPPTGSPSPAADAIR